MQYERSEHVAATPDRVYDVLANQQNLVHFVPQLRSLHRTDGDTVEVEARYDGHSQHGEAWLHTDAGRRRVEWGVQNSEYRGSLEVGPDGDGSTLTLQLTTVHDGDFESDVAGTLDAIRRLLEAEV